MAIKRGYTKQVVKSVKKSTTRKKNSKKKR
jgi:hypothetical protein